MTVNFEIVDNCALNFKGRHIDLHNNFDFIGFRHNEPDRVITLNWKKCNGSWVDKDEFSSLTLTHKEVTFLDVIERKEDSNHEDDHCLGDITFFPSAQRDINDSIIPQAQPNLGDDIIYFFESGRQIRIHGEEIIIDAII